MMNEELRLEWLKYALENHNAVVQTSLPRVLQFNQTADEFCKLALNMLLLLNGGGLAAIPALREIVGEKLPDISLAYSGGIFFFGLVFASISLVAAIVNYRSLAEDLMQGMLLSLAETRKTFAGLVEPPTNEELEELRRQSEKVGKVAIPTSFIVAWGFGIASGLVFVYGGMSLGGTYNPMCTEILGSLCLTR